MRNAGVPTRGIKLSGRKKMNSAIWRNEKGEYTAEEVGLPSIFTAFGASGSRIREGDTRSMRPSRIRVA
jgi:hypothetical protein